MSLKVVTAPDGLTVENSVGRIPVFLAGGITDCPHWQTLVIDRMRQSALSDRIVLLNPRRAVWDKNVTSREQIAWEYRMLCQSYIILFWFPCESVCPIALYELGAWSMTDKSMVIGTHPDYARRVDIIEQTKLARPELLPIRSTLLHVVDDVLEKVQLLEGLVRRSQ